MKNMVSQLNANTGLLFAKKKGTSKRSQSISSELQSMSSFKDADQFYSKLQTLVIGTMGKFRAGFEGWGERAGVGGFFYSGIRHPADPKGPHFVLF